MILYEQHFGSLDRRSLQLLWFAPCAWRAVFTRSNWRAWLIRQPGNNHRCHCPVGTLIDGSLVLAGFGVTFFYSHYTGEVPCWCDKVLSEMEEEESHA